MGKYGIGQKNLGRQVVIYLYLLGRIAPGGRSNGQTYEDKKGLWKRGGEWHSMDKSKKRQTGQWGLGALVMCIVKFKKANYCVPP